MADSRKWILVLVAMALFAGLAGAQSGSPQISCQATAAPPNLRSEGYTELTGDILLTCTGGTPLAQGSVIPTANFTVTMNSTVTSRLLGNGNVTGASEALLLVDDPAQRTDTAASYGNTLAQLFCGSANPNAGAGSNGCTEWVGNTATGTGVPVASNPNTGAGNPPTFNPAPLAPGSNVFQGVVSGGQVTFYGIPIQAPVTSGAFRSFRMTNIRVNANAFGGGALAAVVANVAIFSSSAIPVTNSALTVGYVTPSLATSVRAPLGSSTYSAPATLLQCQTLGTTPTALDNLRFSELQGSAFRIRVANNGVQNQPGQVYTDSESGFVFYALNVINSQTGIQHTAGLADWGTRLKATFNNIPNGMQLYVSVANLPSSSASAGALLTVAENSPFTQVLQTGTKVQDLGGNSQVIAYAPVAQSNGSGSAVWEVGASLANSPENFDFAVFGAYTANPSTNSPPAGSMTVNLSYAPTPPSFTAAQGVTASSTLGIPRFADTSTGKTVATIQVCQTALLYPYVINVGGFDTGLSVANTTNDPFGTAAQPGSCQINWYGNNAPAMGYLGASGYQTTNPTTAQFIQGGFISSWGASTSAPNFSGYVIAVCNFQYAHGFAFVSDLGARNLAMGYLALVIDGGDGAPRNANNSSAPIPTEFLNN